MTLLDRSTLPPIGSRGARPEWSHRPTRRAASGRSLPRSPSRRIEDARRNTVPGTGSAIDCACPVDAVSASDTAHVGRDADPALAVAGTAAKRMNHNGKRPEQRVRVYVERSHMGTIADAGGRGRPCLRLPRRRVSRRAPPRPLDSFGDARTPTGISAWHETRKGTARAFEAKLDSYFSGRISPGGIPRAQSAVRSQRSESALKAAAARSSADFPASRIIASSEESGNSRAES